MNVYNDKQSGKNQNSKPACSYCRDQTHRATDCPHVAGDWASFQRMEIPSRDPNHWTRNPIASQDGQRNWNNQTNAARWYMRPDGWSKWYAECEKAHTKQQQAQARQAASGTTRKSSRCGFCESVTHNRRQCPEMTAMLDRFVSANQGWRQRFYDRFVADLGLSIGAVVKVNVSSWNKDDAEHIGIITGINWDELSMFCWIDAHNMGYRKRVDHKFTQQLRVRVRVDGEENWLNFDQRTTQSSYNASGLLIDAQGNGLVDQFQYNGVTYIETIARSETPLNEEWVTQAHRDSLKFLVKKYSMEKLTQSNVIGLLEKTENFQQSS